MKIFNEKKNRYFAIARRILNKSVVDSIHKTEVQEMICEQGFDEYDYEFYSSLVGIETSSFGNMSLLRENGDRVTPIIQKQIPLHLTTVEKEWLCSILKDDKIRCFLSESTLQKLKEKLNLEEETVCTENQTIYAILKSIQENLWIVCNNTSAFGQIYTNSIVAPYKMEYSKYQDAFWLIGFLVKENKLVKMLIDRMEVVNTVQPSKTIDFDSIISSYLAPNPIVLELTDERGALERALHMFSSYKKDGYYDSDTGIHHLKIYYYLFDEKELMKNIISLGPYVKVIEPKAIGEKIKQMLITQRKL